jgi:hypothetical protein
MVTRVYVNRRRVDHNRRHKTQVPVIVVQKGEEKLYGTSVIILGPSEVVYRPDDLLTCGTAVWIETLSDVIVQ